MGSSTVNVMYGAGWVLSCKDLHNDFIRNILLLGVLSCKCFQCKETVITAEKKSILHLKNGA